MLPFSRSAFSIGSRVSKFINERNSKERVARTRNREEKYGWKKEEKERSRLKTLGPVVEWRSRYASFLVRAGNEQIGGTFWKKRRNNSVELKLNYGNCSLPRYVNFILTGGIFETRAGEKKIFLSLPRLHRCPSSNAAAAWIKPNSVNRVSFFSR